MIAKAFPLPENPEALRAAQSGDLCILLVSEGDDEQLRKHQDVLQRIAGGSIASPVHLTAQRIEALDGAVLEDFVQELRFKLLDCTPFPINPISFRSIYDPYRKSFILKWITELSEPLHIFSRLVEQAVLKSGYKSLYQPGWISTWITALEGIHNRQLPRYLDNIALPEPLFVGSEVVISRINGKNDYIFLDRFSLNPKS